MTHTPSPFDCPPGIGLGRHPDYGLPDCVRLEVLTYADTHGVRAAARVHRVALSSVYKWLAWRRAGPAGPAGHNCAASRGITGDKT